MQQRRNAALSMAARSAEQVRKRQKHASRIIFGSWGGNLGKRIARQPVLEDTKVQVAQLTVIVPDRVVAVVTWTAIAASESSQIPWQVLNAFCRSQRLMIVIPVLARPGMIERDLWLWQAVFRCIQIIAHRRRSSSGRRGILLGAARAYQEKEWRSTLRLDGMRSRHR